MSRSPVRGEIWKHLKTGNHYEIVAAAFNVHTKRLDVVYRPLTNDSDYSHFTRQLRGGDRPFIASPPRFEKVADSAEAHLGNLTSELPQ